MLVPYRCRLSLFVGHRCLAIPPNVQIQDCLHLFFLCVAKQVIDELYWYYCSWDYDFRPCRFLITTNNWDKKKEQGGSMQKSEEGDAIAKFFLYLFIVAFIAFNLVAMKDCSGGTNIPFEETIRHN